MKISSKTHYGVQILSLLAAADGTVSAKELEKRTGVSSKYLEKVLKILLSANAVKATRGKNGGYMLAKDAGDIRMGEIVGALEEDNLEFIDCVNSSGCCCPSSKLWQKLYDEMLTILNGITLNDIVEGNI